MRIIAFKLILLVGVTMTLFSCDGQNNYQKTKGDYNPIGLGKIVPKLDSTIWAIYQDKKSNFWFGSKNNGVYYYDGQQLKQITTEDGLVSNEIRGFQEDLFGNIFIETVTGVCKFDGHAFKTLDIKEDNSLKNEWKLKEEDLWFRMGFNKNGPYRYDGEFLHYLPFPKSPQEDEFYKKNQSNRSFSPYGIYSIYKDSNGFMWFGTTSLGFCRFDGKIISWHFEEQLQTTPSGGDFGSRSIFEDKDGHFWINNTRFRYDVLPNKTNKLDYKKEDGVGYINKNIQMEFPFFLSIEQDNEGDLWMVTYDNGVWRNTGNELIHYPIKDGDSDVLLFKIYKDNQGVLWLGTFNAGVYKFNGKSFEKFEL